jgi:hypothetical protein
MAVQMRCPGCDRTLKILEVGLNTTIRCPACGTRFLARPEDASPLSPPDRKLADPQQEFAEDSRLTSAPRPPAGPAPRYPDERERTPAAPVLRRPSNAGLIVAVVFGAVVVLGSLAVALVLIVRSGTDDVPVADGRPVVTSAPVKAAPPAPNPQPTPRRPGEPADPRGMPGLLGYWSFDEADGERVADGSGNGADGVAHDGRRVPGKKGNALLLDGLGGYFDYGNSPRFNFPAGGPFTFSVWVQAAGDGEIVAQRKRGDGSPVIQFFLERGRVKGLIRQDGNELGGHAALEAPAPGDGQWHHFLLTRDGRGTVAIGVDGRPAASTQSKVADGPLTTDLRTAGVELYHSLKGGGFPPRFLSGALDELCVFNRVLTAQEIEALAGK